MLKRQRSTASFVQDAYTAQEPAIDMFEERVAKRRRQFAPPHLQTNGKGKSPWRGGESDGEEDVEYDEQSTARPAPSEQAQRLERAGEYRNVNTLLHDLHAEQRHRMLFSSTMPLSQVPFAQQRAPEIDHSFSLANKLYPSTVPEHGPHPVMSHQSHWSTPLFTISIPMKDASVVDHVEVQRVTERYEDTNRFLGSLFLSRKRQSDEQNDGQNP